LKNPKQSFTHCPRQLFSGQGFFLATINSYKCVQTIATTELAAELIPKQYLKESNAEGEFISNFSSRDFHLDYSPSYFSLDG